MRGGIPAGLEVPTVYFELLPNPEKLAAERNNNRVRMDGTLETVSGGLFR